jgi:hypothetical protein
MLSLLLATPDSGQWRALTAKPVRWTRNVPNVTTIAKGEQLDFELRYQDPDWDGLQHIRDWLNQPLQIRARLHIPNTSEAVAQGVFIGEAITPVCLSKPPHPWLTGRVNKSAAHERSNSGIPKTQCAGTVPGTTR